MPKGIPLTPEEEDKFQKWYANHAKNLKLNPDPDNPEHHYDYRKAYKAGAEPSYQPEHKQYRWPDLGKDENYNEKIDHATGLPK